MTENEAIRDLEYLIEEYSAYPPETGVNETIGSLQYCITALREIQQYREIGTVEDIKQAIGILSLSENDIVETFHELNEYRKIGTVEECREAVEKQNPKKPKLNYKPRFLGKATYTCPKCGNCCLEEFANERQNNNYCWDCGQAIRWDENLEETENEQIKFGVLL